MGQRATVPKGYDQLTAGASAVGLDLPVGDTPQMALIRGSAAFRWRDDGSDPSSSVGMLVQANEILLYDGKLQDIRFIRVSGDATLDVSYYNFGGA